MPDVKCVLVGDNNVGKEHLLVRYINNEFPPEEIFYNGYQKYSKSVTLGEAQINLTLWDTAADEEWNRVRTILYPQTNVILMCFSIDDPTSFQNIRKKWQREVQYHCPDIPKILVGTKLDLREDKATVEKLRVAKKNHIPYSKGVSLAKKIGAVKYLECSELTQQGVEDVFLQAMTAALNPQSSEAPEPGYMGAVSKRLSQLWSSGIR